MIILLFIIFTNKCNTNKIMFRKSYFKLCQKNTKPSYWFGTKLDSVPQTELTVTDVQNYKKTVEKTIDEFKISHNNYLTAIESITGFYANNATKMAENLTSFGDKCNNDKNLLFSEHKMAMKLLESEHERKTKELKLKYDDELRKLDVKLFSMTVDKAKQTKEFEMKNDDEMFKIINEFLMKHSRVQLKQSDIDTLKTRILDLENKINLINDEHKNNLQQTISSEKEKYANELSTVKQNTEQNHKLHISELEAKCKYLTEHVKDLKDTLSACRAELMAQRDLTKNVAYSRNVEYVNVSKEKQS